MNLSGHLISECYFLNTVTKFQSQAPNFGIWDLELGISDLLKQTILAIRPGLFCIGVYGYLLFDNFLRKAIVACVNFYQIHTSR